MKSTTNLKFFWMLLSAIPACAAVVTVGPRRPPAGDLYDGS